MSPQDVYKQLTTECRKIATLGSCASVLGWEERTYMPRGGQKHRADQLGLISAMYHEMFTSPKIGEWLNKLENSDLVKDPDSIEAANVRELKRAYDKQTKLPTDLVEAISKETSIAQGVWQEARAKKDFKMFAPNLEKVIDLTIQKAEAYGYEGEPYNALLDDYEPGTTVTDVEAAFGGLRDDLVVLLDKIKGAPKKPDKSIVERAYDVDKQKIFGESVAAAMGFDFNAGRLDITTHPFCSGFGPGDTRITTRYNPNRLNDALFGTMHEAGHALYEMGINKEEHFGTPVGESVSLGFHESQSRMWENQVGRSKSFWRYFFPQAQRVFKESLRDVKLDDFYGAINDVQPSYIRVEADEATYNLHILLRFEIERAIVKREIKVADIPGEWDSRFEKYFGIKVDNIANGCLQDVHWSAGLMGYFPTYSLGNLYSAMFFDQAKKEMPDIYDQFERGEFLTLRNWLKEKIHQHGGRYRATDLGKRVTGKELSHKPLIDYMTEKYSEIYGF
ncbi:MAG: carboxypeptidase M32 [bacterium]|nr:carboxypeptidase M32 [bacterium]